MQPITRQHPYFPNLDGLRFLSAFFILIGHVEGIKLVAGKSTIGPLHYVWSLGDASVTVFFVLSGFLITYLLLQEKEQNGNINLKKFYTRRALRIWPLYYFIVLSGFFVLPLFDKSFSYQYSAGIEHHFERRLIAWLLFLPQQFAGIGLSPLHAVGATWSVRVEEVFYFAWPWLLLKTNKYFKSFLAFTLCVAFIRAISMLIGFIFFQHSGMWNTVRAGLFILTQYRVDCMAIGAIGAYLVFFKRERILIFLYRKDVQWVTYLITGIVFFLKLRLGGLVFDMHSILFCIIIINLATNPASVINLNYKWLNYLGKSSYGIYLYNPIMRIFCLELIMLFFNKDVTGLWTNITLYAATIISTLLISIISYELFEKRFLKLKTKFE